jgi:hypothetical protein
MLGGASRINRGRNIHSIDTRYGIAVMAGTNGPTNDFDDEPRAELYDCKVYAELKDNEDCVEGYEDMPECDHCLSRTGMILNLAPGVEHLDKQ